MTKNLFNKSRPASEPYAIYAAGDWIWHICKTYKAPESEAKDQYARWFAWVKSPLTYGQFEGGDTYRKEVITHARLVAADPDWATAQGLIYKYPTPAEYLARA